MKKCIAVAGNIVVDNIKYIENYPAPQALTTITGTARSTGGLCCNCAMILARLDPDLPVKAIGLVGEDNEGDYVLSQFSNFNNIDTSHIKRQGNTSCTDVMTEAATGKRTFFHYRGANALLGNEHFDIKNLNAAILHIGYILILDKLDAPDPDYPTVLCRVLDAAQKEGIRTSIDVVSEDGQRFAAIVPPALKYADYCIINELEASRTTGIPLRDSNDAVLEGNLEKACRALMEMGVKRWVVVHMPEMSCALERDGGFFCEPSWEIPQGFKKSSVGAGDAFASGILYGAYNDWSLKESLHIAGAVAAYSLSSAGASEAIKPLSALLKEMEEFQK